MKNKPLNTKKWGIARIFIYPSKDKYRAVCLDFDIIEEAETRAEVMSQINEAVKGYIVNAYKNNLDDKLLNRNAPEKYWEMYEEYSRLIRAKNETRVKVSRIIEQSSFYSLPVVDLLKGQGYPLA